MRKGQTKDYYIRRAEEVDKQNRDLRMENQKISAAIFGILKTKEKLKAAALEEAEAETQERIKEYEDSYADIADYADRDREKLLAALGMDEAEWQRIAWKY